jgi:hypothetical protein
LNSKKTMSHPNYKYMQNHHSCNIFETLKKHHSPLLTLFNPNKTEILNVATQAPSPSKDYCQLVLTHDKCIFRKWKIMLRGDSESRYPSEVKDSYEDFIHDEIIQSKFKDLV